MDFTIPCETFSRLAKIPLSLDHNDDRSYLKTLRLENINGDVLAIAMTSKLMAVEFLGKTNQPDGSVNIIVSDALVAQAESEKAFNSNLLINVNPMLRFASVKTTFGYNYPTNAALFMDDPREWARWRSIVPETFPNSTYGAMFWNADRVRIIAECAPSGKIVFPDYIDTRRPTVIRDIHDENWFGVFVPALDEPTQPAPARLPGWFKR